MSNTFEDVIRGLIKKAGAVGVKELEDVLAGLKKDADEPWKKVVLNLACDAIDKYGIRGIDAIEGLIDRIGKDEPDLEFASLKTRSDYLAMIQNLEADDKRKVRDFFALVVDKIGVIIKAIIAGLSV